MNFGEAFAYWYLRLNGFFPLTNFVLHRFRDGAGQNADCDVLAVRLPHVYEMIGGEAEDFDNDRFEEWGFDHSKNTIGIIGEVKTGESYTYKSVNGAFNLDRLKYSIYRLGFFEKNQVENIATLLLSAPSVTHGKFTVAKLFIHPDKAPPFIKERRSCEESKSVEQLGQQDDLEIVPCFHLSIEDVEVFIKNRMHKYASHKCPSRMFFSGDLIQYFAWKGDV